MHIKHFDLSVFSPYKFGGMFSFSDDLLFAFLHLYITTDKTIIRMRTPTAAATIMRILSKSRAGKKTNAMSVELDACFVLSELCPG